MILSVFALLIVSQPCRSELTYSIEMDTLDLATVIDMFDIAPGEGIWDQLQMSGNRLLQYSSEKSWSEGYYWDAADSMCHYYSDFENLGGGEYGSRMLMRIHGYHVLGIEDEYLYVYYGYREK